MSKKLITKGLSMLLTLLMLSSALAGCMAARTDSLSQASNENGDPAKAVFTSETTGALDLSTYSIVRPDESSSDLVYAAATLRAHIEQYTGVKIKLRSDAETETANEILIGNTNRSAAQTLYNETKGENWAVKQVGTKVVLAAGELCDIVNATNWFVENCIQKNNSIMVVGDGYATESATGYKVSGFKIGSSDISNSLKIAYIEGDNVGYIDAAILLADNIRRLSGITPTVTVYDDTASGQILVASQTNGGSYSSVTANAMQYAITKRNNNIVIVANDEMGAEMGTQAIITAMINANGAALDLSTLTKSSAVTYTYGNNLNLEYGAEYRIMSYNVERVDSTLSGNTSDRYDEALGNVLFYNPDVVGFQEFCVNYTANLRPDLEAKGYTFVAPQPEYYDDTDTYCASRYSMENNYTSIAYKTAKFDLLASGARRIIPCRTSSDNTIQGTYGWPGYTLTWAVLQDKTTGDVFAVTSLHNKTGSAETDQTKKIDSLAMVKDIVDTKITEVYNCPVFMVGDYNSNDSMKDISSFANESNGIYDARYITERGYASCNSHHSRSTEMPTSIGSASSTIDHIFVTGSAKILRHRFAMTAQVFAASDHKPTFVDVVIGENFSVSNSSAVFTGHNSSMYVNEELYDSVENVIGDIFADNGPLAITEIAPCTTATGYDFVEVMNVSAEPVDLYDYYIHRDTRTHATQNEYSAILMQAVLFQNNNQPTASVRHRLASSSMILGSGEVAIIWLTDQSANVDTFKSTWGISSSTVKISKVSIPTAHTIKTLYTADVGDNKVQSGAVGSYLSQNYKVSYSLTIAHEDFSSGLANYDVFKSKSANTFNSSKQIMLKKMASCVAVVLSDVSCCGTSTENRSAVFKSFYSTDTSLQAAINAMTTVATKNKAASNFYRGLETLDETAACYSVSQTYDATVTPMPECMFDQAPTPGTVGEHNFTNMNGKLAITEICYNPDDARYEFVEVVNTSENSADLRDYYVYRFGFSNGGTWHATGIMKMFGYASQTCAKLVRLSLSDVTGDTALAKDEVAILWFASAASKDETVDDFKSYWTGKDADMTNVNVIKVPVYDSNGNDMYPANHGTDSLLQINKNAGNSFLPDSQSGFVISMINKSFADTDNIEPDVSTTNASSGTTTYSWSAASTQSRHNAADAIALVMLDKNNSTVSAQFNEYIDASRFTAARDNVAAKDGWTRNTAEPIYSSLMVFDSSDVTNYWNDQDTTANKLDIIFPTVNQGATVTPGRIPESAVVVEGVQTKTNANNTADLRFVASLKGSYLDYLGAGFEFTYNRQVTTVNCKHVYRTLNSNEGVISAEDYGADYFFCYTLKNLSAGTYTITVRSWSNMDGSDQKIYSEAKTATFTVASDGSVTIG